MRARTPEAALAVVLRLLVAQRLADPDGLPNADRQGVYEPRGWPARTCSPSSQAESPSSVKRHTAEREAERELRKRAWRDEQAAKFQAQRAKLEAGEPIGCECCRGPIESAAEAVERHGSLVHAGACADEWQSASDTNGEID